MNQDPMTTILNLVQRARDIGLGEELYSPEVVRAARTTERALSDDGTLTRLGGYGLPPQRLDWIIPPGEPAGAQIARYAIPSTSRGTRVSIVATGNLSATFTFDLLVNGIRRASGSCRAGTPQSHGSIGVEIPPGSVLSIETKSTVSQGVTVSIFYRPVEE